jgi:hypothetical protein
MVGEFGTVDAKLTVYALANGMDLIKGEDFRRLEWYLDGMDRGILVSVTSTGAIEVSAMAWSGDVAAARSEGVIDAIAPEDLVADLTGVLGGAIERANAL